MHFLNPIFLWGLLGLSIPIGIHLLSRKEGKVIKFGSLRHLQETSTKQFKGIKLNELMLLSLRCVLIILFCLLLSGLYLNSTGEKKWVVVEKGIENQNSELLDSLKKEGYESHWLSKGLPELILNDSSGFTSEISYAQAIEELNKLQISNAIVFAKNDVSKFSGARTSLPTGIRWISVVGDPSDYDLYTIQFRSDSAVVRRGHTDYMQTNYTNEKIRKISDEINYLKEIDITLVSDDNHADDKRMIKAALTVIESEFHYKINITESSLESTLPRDSSRWTIWLADKAISENNLKIIDINVRPDNELFVQETSNHWSITKRLTEETALTENLTLRLAVLIIPNKKSFQKIADQHDRRMVPDSIAWSHNTLTAGTSAALLNTSLSSLLLAILFITLVTERLIAYHRNQ